MRLRLALSTHAVVLATLAGIACADGYPSKPVRLILPFAPGGGADFVARIVAQHLSEVIGQPVVVDNRAGGGATIGTEMGARANPDGYTLLVGSSTSLSVNPVLMKVRYDPVRDFTPITLMGTQPHVVVVNPSVAAKSLHEFVALAKAKPGAFHYSSSGNGGPGHLACELFKQATGTDLVHVPYKGQGAAIISVAGGEVQFSIPSIASVLPQVRTGKLRALAVTSPQRLGIASDLPTMAEEGYPGFESTSWTGLMAPVGIAPGIVRMLQQNVAAVMKDPELMRKFASAGVEPGGNSTAEFTTYVRNDIAKWARVVTTARIRVD